jgi:hypothetical protein
VGLCYGGDPQGAVNSPLLFAIYINDFVDPSLPVLFSMFADDILAATIHNKGMRFATQMKHLRVAADQATCWGNTWHLSFSVDKSLIMIVGNTNKETKFKPIQINGNRVATVSQYKYLGLILQQNGKWNAQFEAVASRCKITAALIGRINHRNRPPNPPTVCRLVLSTLIPPMTYSLAFWRPIVVASMLLQIIANPLRKALGLPHCASAVRTLWEFGVPTVPTLRACSILQSVSRAYNSAKKGNWLPSLLVSHINDTMTNNKTLKYCRPFSLELKELTNLYPQATGFPLDKKIIKSITTNAMTAEWRASSSWKARAIKSDPGIAKYIQLDSKPLVCLRARCVWELR